VDHRQAVVGRISIGDEMVREGLETVIPDTLQLLVAAVLSQLLFSVGLAGIPLLQIWCGLATAGTNRAR
jgi:hypothetical protein